MARYIDDGLTVAVFHDWSSILSKAEPGHLIGQRLPSTYISREIGACKAAFEI